jgi:hypothetical protein
MKRVIFFCTVLCLLWSPVWAGSTATSGSTASDFVTDLRNDLNEDSAGFWSSDDLLQWLDEAVWEVVARTGCLESGTSTIVLKENVRRYSVVNDFLYLHTVEYDSGDTTSASQIYTLDRVDKRDIGHNQQTGPPKIYCVWANNLEVWPIPRNAQSGTSLYVYPVDVPSGVTATTSTIETPAYFDTALKYFVKARAMEKDSRLEEAEKYMSRFDAMVEMYFRTVTKRGIEQINAENR